MSIPSHNPTTHPTSNVEKSDNIDSTQLPRIDSKEATATSSKTTAKQTTLNIPTARRARSPSPDTVSLLSNDDFSELRRVHSSFSATDADPVPSYSTLSPEHTHRAQSRLHAFWLHNKGLFLVLLSQIFGTGMNIGTRLLENLGRNPDGTGGMHPFQIIFARMSITTLLSMTYMYITRTPDFPLGAKEVRWILVARGLGGFFGVFGLYWSLQYLPLADATVLTFLAPFIACAVCAKLLKEPFTRVEAAGGVASLVGVVLIARPTSFFGGHGGVEADGDPAPGHEAAGAGAPQATNEQRLAAVGMAMVGVAGAVVAYTTIRWIGTRAHPLISVNYFATWCTIVSAFMLLCIPGIPFIFPRNLTEWALLLLIGIGGFAMQFLLTAGLRYEKSSRATNMVYSQMLFALAADRIIWGTVPTAWSLAGSALILSAAVIVAVQKEGAGKTTREEGRRDEEAALVEGAEGVEMHEGVSLNDTADRPEMEQRGRSSSQQLEASFTGTRHSRED